MFNLDKWQEIATTIRKNKMRTFLTAFSIAWGIFLLVVLLGAGSGFLNGVLYQWRDDAMNSFKITPGTTSMPYKGMKPGKKIQLTNEDFDKIAANVEGVEHITARYFLSGEYAVRYKLNHARFTVRSTHPGHQYYENTIITEGRFLNELDLKERRKVAVIGENVVKVLSINEDPLGKWIEINQIPYKIVGVFIDAGATFELSTIYIPISTAQMVYNGANRVHEILFTTGTASLKDTRLMSKQTKNILVEHHKFSPEDHRAMDISNNNEIMQKFLDMISGIKFFIWIIGVGTITAGIVGVSNIMMISINERTREIGIRKAIGATPGSIISLVLQESFVITLLAGYCGLVAGVAVVEFASWAFEHFKLQSEFFRNPEIDFKTVITATLFLVFAGVLAGFFPARLAAKIKPVEALREE